MNNHKNTELQNQFSLCNCGKKRRAKHRHCAEERGPRPAAGGGGGGGAAGGAERGVALAQECLRSDGAARSWLLYAEGISPRVAFSQREFHTHSDVGNSLQGDYDFYGDEINCSSKPIKNVLAVPGPVSTF